MIARALGMMLLCAAAPVAADTRGAILALHNAADAQFGDAPALTFFEDIAPFCAGQSYGTARVRYCEGSNRLGTSRDDQGADLSYWVARVLAYAAQEVLGVVLDAEIRIYREPKRDAEFRRDASQQSECLAGRLYQLAGLGRPDLELINAHAPFAFARWGRGPYRSGSQAVLPAQAQAKWFDQGYTSDQFSQCTVGPFSGMEFGLRGRAFR